MNEKEVFLETFICNVDFANWDETNVVKASKQAEFLVQFVFQFHQKQN